MLPLQGGEVDEKGALLRETLKQIRLKHIEEFSHHAEKSCIMADAPGLLFFDGGSYSLSLSDIGASHAPMLCGAPWAISSGFWDRGRPARGSRPHRRRPVHCST